MNLPHFQSQISYFHRPQRQAAVIRFFNARSFERQGYSVVLEEEEITEASLGEAIRKLYQERNKYIAAMSAGKNLNSIQQIVNLTRRMYSFLILHCIPLVI